MTILYKLNNSGTVSWWEIEAVYVEEQPNPEEDVIVTEERSCITATGYNTWWGSDHTTRSRMTQNTQFTPASDKPTLSVESQIHSQIQEKIARKGYSRDIPSSSPELPMLAQTWVDFVEKANSINSRTEHWPSAFIQPKLDGIRCIATPISLYSRRNVAFTSIPHIEMAMNALLDTEFSSIKLDGELYIQGADLQTIQGVVSSREPNKFLYKSIVYHVFDVVDQSLSMSERVSILDYFQSCINPIWNDYIPEGIEKPNIPCPIQIVPTVHEVGPTDDSDFITRLHKHNTLFRNLGYEGTILRNPSAKYQPNYRTFDLIKYKEFADSEFLILDVLPVKNNQGVFLCQTMHGKTFKCSPSWTASRKEAILRYKDNYVGRKLTVKYERLSQEGIPLKPIGVTIRDPKH